MFKGKRVIVVSYADGKYKKAQHYCAKSAKLFGNADFVYSLGPECLDKNFQERNKKILEISRGAGLWIWKPYVLLKVLSEVEEGEYVFYCDSAVVFIRSINYLLDTMKEEEFIWVSDCPFIEEEWTKPSVFEYFGMDTALYGKTCQIEGGFVIVKKNEKSVMFIQEWLKLCEKYELVKPVEDTEIRGACIQNRDDQSLLSLLCKTKGIEAHKDPSQFGKVPEKYLKEKKNIGTFSYRVPVHQMDKYKPVLVLHRTPNLEIKTVIKCFAIAFLPAFISKKMLNIINGNLHKL